MKCQEPNCENIALECILPWPAPDDEPEYYCSEHADKHGYCYGCGLFCAGIDSFSFGRYKGLCDNCADQVKANEWEDDEDFDYNPYLDPYVSG